MTLLFSGQDSAPVALAAMQRQVGEVHARADSPVGLVSRGMRHLKLRVRELLVGSELDREGLADAVGHVDGLMDLAFSEMSSAYVRAHEQGARTGETFRLVTAGQNLALERHRQLAAITDWENGILRALATGTPLDAVSQLRASAFGLWMQHKAPLMFETASELAIISEQIHRLDRDLMPLLVSNQNEDPTQKNSNVLRDFLACLEECRFVLNTVFDRLVDMEVGRDVLTQLYNRRFLSTILRRELELARGQHNRFAVLMVDVDHFKHVNDSHGHEMGDRVLQHLAVLLQGQARASDFVFRYGGEEFLVVINEVTPPQAEAVAEKIRARIEQTPVAVAQGSALAITVSIGLAMYDGHPDYRHLVSRADQALYEAKSAGRNRVAVATAG
jgi:diguanylate cyclase